MDKPGLRWEGQAYLDSNWGAEPLEDCFSHWNWSRAHLQNGDTAVIYEPHQKNLDTQLLAWRFDPQGGKTALPLGAVTALPATTIWRVERASRCDLDSPVTVRKTLEDTPFYARTLLDTQLQGEPAVAVHESLSLERFAQPWVQRLLPFRMPRRANRISTSYAG
jgi:carotenoid 1,2-hydratase